MSCLDSRIPVEDVFDRGTGDVFVARVAGNFEDTDILGSLEFATAVVADLQFARRVEAMLEDDLSHCDEVLSGHLENERLHTRIQARIARLAAPLL